MGDDMRWTRGAGAWSVTTGAGAPRQEVLLRSWPPRGPVFRDDKGATTELWNGHTIAVASPEAGQRVGQRHRRTREFLASKPAATAKESMLRAPVAEVLKLRCAACRGIAGFFVTWSGATTLADVLAEGRWLPSVLPNSCPCTWGQWPDASTFKRQLGTALARGLDGGHARGVKVECMPLVG